MRSCSMHVSRKLMSRLVFPTLKSNFSYLRSFERTWSPYLFRTTSDTEEPEENLKQMRNKYTSDRTLTNIFLCKKVYRLRCSQLLPFVIQRDDELRMSWSLIVSSAFEVVVIREETFYILGNEKWRRIVSTFRVVTTIIVQVSIYNFDNSMFLKLNIDN